MSITPESVKELLNSEDFGERIRGLNQLRQIEKETAFDLVQPMITDDNTRVRYAAVSQLDTLGTVNKDVSLTMLRDRLFNDPEPDVQAAAADAIGGLKLVEAYDDLAKVYRDTPEWLVQFSIIAALGELGNDSAIPLLAEFADHEDWQIRYRLVQALGRLGGTEAKRIITTLTDDESDQVAKEAKNNLK